MSVLARKAFHAPTGRLCTWAGRAWRRFSWKHVLLAVALNFVLPALNPLGGVLFPPADLPGWDRIARFFDGAGVFNGLMIVFSVLVADEAFEDGVSPLRAYGLAAIAIAVGTPLVRHSLAAILISLGAVEHLAGEDEGIAQLVWWWQAALYKSAFGLSIYAYWRVTQRAVRQAQAAETEQARNEQRVQTARLLALQARVEPQLLFDALNQVRSLHTSDAQAADALLADLIALLRAMQPTAKKDTSSVENEFELAEAWVRVARSAGRGSTRLQLHIAPEARSVGIAPMLVLPLLRSVFRLRGANECQWLLSASVLGPRLIVTLQQAEAGHEQVAIGGVDVASIQDRLAQLFGQSARLTVSSRPPSVELDLPRLHEDSNDDRADR